MEAALDARVRDPACRALAVRRLDRVGRGVRAGRAARRGEGRGRGDPRAPAGGKLRALRRAPGGAAPGAGSRRSTTAGFGPASMGNRRTSPSLIRYGNVREVDPAPLRPGAGAAVSCGPACCSSRACVCDDQAVPALRQGMDRMHDVAFLGEEGIDPALWIKARARRLPRATTATPSSPAMPPRC